MSIVSKLFGRIDRAVGSVEENLKAVYGGAQIDRRSMGTQAPRSGDRLDGVPGEYEVHRDATGRTYLVTKPPARHESPRPEGDGS